MAREEAIAPVTAESGGRDSDEALAPGAHPLRGQRAMRSQAMSSPRHRRCARQRSFTTIPTHRPPFSQFSDTGGARMYRGQSGQWSWLLHRITGLGVLLFLLVHIVDITLIGFGPTVYNDAIAIFSTGIIRLVSVALIASVIFHAFNGIRIILIDFWPAGYKFQRPMFNIVLVISIISTLVMAYYVLAPAFGLCPQGACSAPAM
jgi:succinate dehydrogenase cytochrome b subunit